MKTVLLPSGRAVAALGQGSWNMGEDRTRRQAEIDALRLGVELGMNLIDTAEMYAEGGSEEVVGEAIAGQRERIYLVSKVYPHNADRRGVQAACERSLRRLNTDYLDLYLLHWRGAVPLDETLEAFTALKQAGKIRDFGVSNFDLNDMREASALKGGKEIAVNQVLYNLAKRGVEWDLLPWSREHGIALMAYSPLESSGADQRRLLDNPALKSIAETHGASAGQIALAWLLRQEGVIVIPKAVKPEHVRANHAALDIVLTQDELAKLDRAFAPPRRSVPLAMR